MHLRSFFRKLGHRLTVFNRIRHVLDRKTRIAYFNGLVLPHLDYADIIWGDQPGLKAEMDQLQAFQNRFAKKIELKKKLSSAEALKLLNWMPLSSRRFAHRVKLVQNAIKGEIPQHLNCFKQIANHRWELRNNYLPRLVRPRTEWRRRATYYKAITDWNSLPKSLRTLMPRTIFDSRLFKYLVDN